LAERNQAHVNALFCNVKETKHQKQFIATGLANAKQVAMGCQLLEFAEMAEEVVDALHDQGKVPQSTDC
jgi:hypothetical protein